MDREELLKIIGNDDLGLLKTKPKASNTYTSEDRLLASFQEINSFVREFGHEPQPNNQNMLEFKLFSRLNSLRYDNDKIKALKDYDEFNLLTATAHINSINDIFENDDLGILDDASDSIFNIRHIKKETTMPDYVAKRKACKDFAKFEHLFKQCQSDIASEKRKLSPFAKEQQIDKGLFFVLKGILLYVADIGEREVIDGRTNARLRCIFENGTESDMLLRSLAAELYKNGRRVTEHTEKLLDGFENISNEDEETGYIYVLKSLSDKTEIKSINNLFKIGFSKTPVEDRIKNATKEPTYLMAPVSIITAYRCYNLNPQKMEMLLHTFFGKSCLNIDIFDAEGKRYTPREWFIAPLEIIEQAITLIINGEIIYYNYDMEKQEILQK